MGAAVSTAQAAMQVSASRPAGVTLQQLLSQQSGSVLMHCMELLVVDSTVGRRLWARCPRPPRAGWLEGGSSLARGRRA